MSDERDIDDLLKRFEAIQKAKASGTYVEPYIPRAVYVRNVYVGVGTKWGKRVAKVGIAGNVEARIKTIQASDCGDIVLKKAWVREGDSVLIEWMVKKMLADRCYIGEFFRVPLKTMIDTVELAIGLSDAKACHLFKRGAFPKDYADWCKRPEDYSRVVYEPHIEKLVQKAAELMGDRCNGAYRVRPTIT